MRRKVHASARVHIRPGTHEMSCAHASHALLGVDARRMNMTCGLMSHASSRTHEIPRRSRMSRTRIDEALPWR